MGGPGLKSPVRRFRPARRMHGDRLVHSPRGELGFRDRISRMGLLAEWRPMEPCDHGRSRRYRTRPDRVSGLVEPRPVSDRRTLAMPRTLARACDRLWRLRGDRNRTVGLLAAFFRSFDFGAATSGWAVLAAACNWTLTRTYGDYVGGEPALLAALPWLALATRRALAAGWFSWVALPALYWLGAMAKLSYPPMAAGLIAGFRGRRLWGLPLVSSAKLREVARWIGWLALGQLLLWGTYLRRGANPLSSPGAEHRVWWNTILEIASFPVSSAFSLGSIAGRIFLHPSHPLAASLHALWPMNAAFAAGGVALVSWLLRREFPVRPRLCTARAGRPRRCAYTAFFLLVATLGSNTGMEERYFKPVGFLLLPGIVAGVRSGRSRRIAWIVGGALSFSSLYGVAAVVNRAHYLATLDNVGLRGITQHVISRDALRALHEIDAALPPDSLIVVPSPKIALDVRHARVMSTHAAMTPAAELASNRYRGRAKNLIILANARMGDAIGQTWALVESFAR